ncbi:S49 family peptidase [Neorhizobium sp. T786]|uniref:S49 family peptidase n=1 Tax=Pseudorhizobium xiangyangii TaxID=2883104 RepID=UPI001CFFC23F|nr:S49 family peptidase [Neorhizobium xiangyangii]MCB5201713.1 S49 family peptidase [Neorhizobium xiangyangii]
MRDLPHLASLIFNRPLLFRGDIGTGIIDAIGPRILSGERIDRTEVVAAFERPSREARAPGGSRRLAGGAYMDRDGIAVLPIVGSLVRRGTWLDAECGMMSYGLIQNAVAEILLDASVRGLMLEIDSSGGEANGCFDCADFIKVASATSGKPVWAHANEIMCSAAYGLGSSASKIWVARTGEVGSIGVLGAHVDRSAADKMAGVKWTYIFAGEHKTDGNPHEPLGEGTLARMQTDVDHLMDMFVDLASQNRGMTGEEIRATNAEIFRGSLAVESGLADEVGTLDEALQAFEEHVDEMQTSGSTRMSASQMRTELMSTNRGKPGANITASKPEDKEDKSKAAATEEEGKGDEEDEGKKAKADEEEGDAGKNAAAFSNAAVKAETERCSGLFAVAKQAARLGVTFNAEAAINSRMSVADARAKVMDAAASGDAPETSAIAAPKVKGAGQGGHKSMSAEDKAAAWKKAHARKR